MDKKPTDLDLLRHKARLSRQNWHSYPLAEEKIHTLDITQVTVDNNFACAISREGTICFCEPDVEDYTDDGGGVLIKHRQVTWQ